MIKIYPREFNPMNYSFAMLSSAKDIQLWFEQLIDVYKLNFNPDTPFYEYMNPDNDKGTLLFASDYIKHLQSLLDHCFDYCAHTGIDIYELAIKANNAVNEHSPLNLSIVKDTFSWDNSNLFFEGWHNPQDRWNGWACPLFPKASVEKIIAAFILDKTTKWEWDGDNLKWFEEGQEVEVIEPSIINPTGDQQIMVWPVGANYWTWSELTALEAEPQQTKLQWKSAIEHAIQFLANDFHFSSNGAKAEAKEICTKLSKLVS